LNRGFGSSVTKITAIRFRRMQGFFLELLNFPCGGTAYSVVTGLKSVDLLHLKASLLFLYSIRSGRGRNPGTSDVPVGFRSRKVKVRQPVPDRRLVLCSMSSTAAEYNR